MVGAIITASVFLIFKPKSSRNTSDFSQFGKDGFNPSSEGFDRKSMRNRNNSSNENDESKVVEDKQDEKQD